MSEHTAENDAALRRRWRLCADVGAEFEAWAVLALLDALDAAEARADARYDEGYREGQKAATFTRDLRVIAPGSAAMSSAENGLRTARYTDGADDVLVAVPWERHAGLIPPPTITFGHRTFAYDEDGPRVVIPPGVQHDAGADQ